MSALNGETPLIVALSIPCRAEYVGVARLAILGVASRLDFSYDEVEDLRLAVGEACTGAIDCTDADEEGDASIDLRCEIAAKSLTVEVSYKCPSPKEPSDGVQGDPENIGALLMEILVDSVCITNDPNTGTTIRLTKTVQAS